MKKPDPKQREFARRQQSNHLDRIRRYKRVHKDTAKRLYYRQPFGPRREPIWRSLNAPENFSFIDNTEVMVGFFGQMERAFRSGHDVFVDFSRIKQLSPDSLAVFVSKMKDRKITRGLNCSGNEPEDEQIKKKFIESGFYEVVVTREERAHIASGSFRKKASKKVNPIMIDDMIAFANKTLFGEDRQCGGVTNALVETMGNTRGHAHGGRNPHETWWAYVYCDIEKKIATYCLVDNGVGIFQSRKVGRVRLALNKIGKTSNIEILQKMLRRQIESSTGVPYRGRGIPSIYKSLQRGDIRNLTFIANDVIAKVEKDEYHTLTAPFKGTFVSWEYHGDSNGKANTAGA